MNKLKYINEKNKSIKRKKKKKSKNKQKRKRIMNNHKIKNNDF